MIWREPFDLSFLKPKALSTFLRFVKYDESLTSIRVDKDNLAILLSQGNQGNQIH